MKTNYIFKCINKVKNEYHKIDTRAVNDKNVMVNVNYLVIIDDKFTYLKPFKRLKILKNLFVIRLSRMKIKFTSIYWPLYVKYIKSFYIS